MIHLLKLNCALHSSWIYAFYLKKVSHLHSRRCKCQKFSTNSQETDYSVHAGDRISVMACGPLETGCWLMGWTCRMDRFPTHCTPLMERWHSVIFPPQHTVGISSKQLHTGRIQWKTWRMGPNAGVDYNSPYVDSNTCTMGWATLC
jgi:hypothetical protein